MPPAHAGSRGILAAHFNKMGFLFRNSPMIRNNNFRTNRSGIRALLHTCRICLQIRAAFKQG